jgi:hypothetical protein
LDHRFPANFPLQGRHKDTSVSLNALLCWVRSQVSLWLRHKNPFVDHTQAPHSDTSVLTFEVGWEDVVGMDFSWRLTEDARLVLEAAHVAKRVFHDVSKVCSLLSCLLNWQMMQVDSC